jgi:7-cyano-7-deazaguanine synthase in queuosine biosynthesis
MFNPVAYNISSMADARRIVSCVNVCAGIAYSDLEKVGPLYRDYIDKLDTAISEASNKDARIAELEAELKAEREQAKRLKEELHQLYVSTVSILETARDIKVGTGRPCESVDEMERGNPALIRARESLAAYADQ